MTHAEAPRVDNFREDESYVAISQPELARFFAPRS